ncbi:hypothetical protein VV02_19835 [Luteipulveratus mongoliensis]|uniref:HD/PDEase domain-containing protein n=1 Tax=Luteipulveratus mongoliensis TaxID=571913 RepID=A0A0K1JLV7_9MICO|nr:hypothetical protein VV02_19835 [Luteipulveratus mongoliensis]
MIVSVTSLIVRQDTLPAGSWLLAGCCFIVMFGGELLRLGGLGARGLSPIAVAGALSFALASELPGQSHLQYDAAFVVVVAFLALVLGVVVQAWHGDDRIVHSAYAVRILMIGIVALLFRQIGVRNGSPLADMGPAWAEERWRMVAAMVAVALFAHGVELVVHVTLRSLRDERSWPTLLREDLVEMVPTSLAAISTGVVIALGLRTLHVFAIPLFMVPLLLMRFAMQRQQRTQTARRETIAALSRMTDLAGYTRPGHSGRVSKLCVAVGSHLHLADRDLKELESAALLHDIGQVTLRDPIPAGATVEAAPLDQERIAHDGAEIVRRTGAKGVMVQILEQQAVPFRHMVEQNEPQLMQARILKVCNAFDDFSHGDPDRRQAALQRLRLGLGYEYDPQVVDALTEVTARSLTAV